MDKDVMQAFLNSTAVSSKFKSFPFYIKLLFTLFIYILASKGNAANMLKSGIKRRRTQQEIKYQ